MIELGWLGVSLFAGLLTAANLVRAYRVWRTYRDGPAHRIVARGNLRRDIFRLASCVGCIVIVIPALLREGDTPLSLFVLAAAMIPVSIAANSFYDRRDQRHVERVLAT